MIILLFRELLGRCNRKVVCACQACDAGSKAKMVVASGAAVLTFTHQRWRAVSRHSNVPSVSTTSQFSGGRVSASVHPAHKTLVDSSRRVRCIVCSAAAATAGGSVTASSKLLFMYFEVPGSALASVSAAAFMLLCAATAVAVAGAFGTVVVCALPFELADGGFTRMSVFVTLIVSAGVFTLVDFYCRFAGRQPAFEEPQQQAAAAGCHYASEAQATPRVDVGDPPEASSFHLCEVSSCVTS